MQLGFGLVGSRNSRLKINRTNAHEKQVVALSDASKLGTQDPFAVCRLSEVSHIITERDPTDPLFEAYQKAGVHFL